MLDFDIIVVGGGTAGCACAYTAGKYGLKVLLIEKNTYLGGTITGSLVTPAMKTSSNAINTDFFDTFYNELEQIGGAATYQDGNKGWINPELTKIVLDKLMKEAHVKVLLESHVSNIDDKLLSYIVTVCNDNILQVENNLLPSIETKLIVDATGDAIICKMLNCEFLENENKSQPSSLRFIMSGVNSKVFSDWVMKLDNNRDVTSSCVVNDNVLLSTAYTWDASKDWALAPLFKQAINDNILQEEDTNYFQIFSVAGTSDSIAFNCPRILDSDLSRTDAYIKGRESILRLSQFCNRYLPGFEKAYISSIAHNLGIRESCRVKAKYVYTKNDLISGKKFDNPVVISNYPIDVHSSKKDSSKLEIVNQEYTLPLESLIVKENLYVIGRCISADFEAQAALRIIPSCFSMGEGLAKYLAKNVHI